jgi:hypothetical protein
MLQKLDTLIRRIEESEEPSLSLISLDLVEVFETYYAPSIGRMMVQLRGKSVRFDFEVKEVKDHKEAFDLVKSADSYGQKVIYSLKFLGLFNRAASKGTEKFVKVLTSKEE